MIMERINTVTIICLFVAISTAVALQVGVSKVDGMVYAGYLKIVYSPEMENIKILLFHEWVHRIHKNPSSYIHNVLNCTSLILN